MMTDVICLSTFKIMIYLSLGIHLYLMSYMGSETDRGYLAGNGKTHMLPNGSQSNCVPANSSPEIYKLLLAGWYTR